MKIGDKIKCIDANDSNNLWNHENYTVVDINSYGNIKVQRGSNGELLEHYYKPDRFIVLGEQVTKIDLTKQYKTRGGAEVKLFAISDDDEYPIVGQFKYEGKWANSQWQSNGAYFGGQRDDWDLVEVKPSEYWFVNGDIYINKDLEEVSFEGYAYTFDTLRSLLKEIDG